MMSIAPSPETRNVNHLHAGKDDDNGHAAWGKGRSGIDFVLAARCEAMNRRSGIRENSESRRAATEFSRIQLRRNVPRPSFTLAVGTPPASTRTRQSLRAAKTTAPA